MKKHKKRRPYSERLLIRYIIVRIIRYISMATAVLAFIAAIGKAGWYENDLITGWQLIIGELIIIPSMFLLGRIATSAGEHAEHLLGRAKRECRKEKERARLRKETKCQLQELEQFCAAQSPSSVGRS